MIAQEVRMFGTSDGVSSQIYVVLLRFSFSFPAL